MRLSDARYSRFSDMDRGYDFLELVNDGIMLTGVGFSDDLVFEILFDKRISNLIFERNALAEVMADGKSLPNAIDES